MADLAASAWSLLLDEMEAELGRDHGTGLPWSPPTSLEQLPPELADRAQRLVDAQQRAITELAIERSNVARHLTALRTVPAPPGDRSVYLDVLG